MSSIKDEWIFYLKLTPRLNENFLSLDRNLKQFGFSLIPVSFPNLIELIKAGDNFHLVIMVSSKQEADYYLRHVSKSIRNLLRFKKINLFCASSFSFINESSKLSSRDNYNFYPLPMRTGDFCDKILSTLLDSAVENKKWPGGKSPKISMTRGEA